MNVNTAAITKTYAAPLATAAANAIAVPTEVSNQSRVAADEYVQSGQKANNTGLKSLVQGIDRAIATSEMKFKALAKEADSNPGFMRQFALQNELKEASEGLDNLKALRGQVAKLDSNPAASAVDAQRLMIAAADFLGTESRGIQREILTSVEGLVRDAGRVSPSDPGLQNATKGLVEKIGQLDNEISDLRREASVPMDSKRAQQLQFQLLDLESKRDRLVGLKGSADKVAARSEAGSDAASQMSHMLVAATGTNDPLQLRAAANVAADIARNVGREEPTNRNLQAASLGNAIKLGDLDEQISALSQEAQTTTDSMRLQQLQIKVADLVRDRDTLTKFDGQAARILNNPATTPEVAQHMSALLAESGGTTDIVRQYQILTEMQQLGR